MHLELVTFVERPRRGREEFELEFIRGDVERVEVRRDVGLLAVVGMGSFADVVQAQPQEVVIGSYINKIQDLDFPGNKYVIDFYLWFRWKAEGTLADYNPMESFEIMNGTIESREAQDAMLIGDVMYAQARVSAIMNENWQMAKFPFDSHSMTVNIEDNSLTTKDLVFVNDENNSKLGDEINIAGWDATDFSTEVITKVYQTNYGDISQPSDARSDYSRYMIKMSIKRQSYGSALKLLTPTARILPAATRSAMASISASGEEKLNGWCTMYRPMV